jgi:2-iminobutanoate/2-iminopropanoate deaminase
MKELILSAKGPKPGGAYSPALRVGDFVFVAGQVPVDPATGEVVGTTIEEQTVRVLENIRALLEAAGASMADVVRCTVHLSDINNFKRFNEVYATKFPDPKPTRTTVQSVLAARMLVEIDAIAYKPRG